MNTKDIYLEISKRIRLRMDFGWRRFAICPMGQNGLMSKQILNWQYGVNEEMIIDNGLAAVNPHIFSIADLTQTELDKEIVVLLNTTTPKANAELYDELARVLPKEQICNILEQAIIKSPQKGGYFTQLRELLRVADVKGNVNRVRVGSDYDGGYVLLEDFQQIKAAYSFGIGNNVSWDKAIAGLGGGIHVFQYDHTIEELPEKNPKFSFFRIGIADRDDIESRVMSLESILNQNGHKTCNNMILKMDVEGAEWDVLNSVKVDVIEQFSQIVLELHDMTNTDKANIVLPALKKLNTTHRVVWLHGNNRNHVEEADNIFMPMVLEATFARRSSYTFEESETVFPLDIDMPNFAERKDIILGKWNGE
jgi:hypothetical protein